MKKILAALGASLVVLAAIAPVASASTEEVIQCQKPCTKTQQACLHTCYDGKPNAPRSCGQACEDELRACNKRCIAKYGLDK